MRIETKSSPMESEERDGEQTSNGMAQLDGDSEASGPTQQQAERSSFRSEEWYQQSQERFRSLLENSYDAIALVSENTNFVYASPSIHRVLGYTSEELIGRNELELVHPEDLELAQGVFTELLQTPGDTVSVQLRVRHRDGSWRWVEIVGTNLLAEPSVEAIVVYFCDITERKRTEDRLRARVRQQAVVAELGQIALGRMNLSELMNSVVARVTQTLDVEHSDVFELLPEGRELLLRAGVGWRAGAVGHARVSADRGSQAGYTLHSSEPVVMEDSRTETRFRVPPLLVEQGLPEQLRQAKLVLWRGHCSVHTRFTVKQIQAARERYPDITVLVHPECIMETVQAADLNGSTEFIRKTINEAPAGSKWAVGTEISLVNRLALHNPDKIVFCLDPVSCPCSTMYRIHPAYLLWVLEGLLEGQVVNQITVPEQTRQEAFVALERMLALK